MSVKALTTQRKPTRSPVSRIEWDVTVSPETKIEDLLTPSFWTHVSDSTFSGENNIVNVYWEDKSQVAFLYVRYYDNTSAKMELLDHKVFGDKVDIVAPEKYEIKWSGPNTRFRIIRLSDGQVLRENLSSKDDAALFVKELESRNK